MMFWSFADSISIAYSLQGLIIVIYRGDKMLNNQSQWREDAERRFRSAGLRVTPQRMAVYDVLSQSSEHPSAEMVWRQVRQDMPNVSLDTVNRTLNTFSEAGMAFIVEGSGDAKRFDGNLGDHQHFKCVKCKRIIDFHHLPFDNIEVPEEIGAEFTVLRKTVYFEGICDVCGAK
ncbi:MAG: transcriptional repressor [Anaerohalosphaera sp.]|nr:transcriptional repressor [Anaerohalosphaera sp.]